MEVHGFLLGSFLVAKSPVTHSCKHVRSLSWPLSDTVYLGHSLIQAIGE